MFTNCISLSINKTFSDEQIISEIKHKHDFSQLELKTNEKNDNDNKPLLSPQ